ncbi:MAG TPA: DUF3499 family protein [Acidimicrobiales bacterium]|nr:DUF3499 family protein [Acidimicrobiales bacterium]
MDRRLFCVRPMCGASAGATLHYDYQARTAWLDSLGADTVPGAWSVCAGHADTLRVPSGWRLIDQRPSAALAPLGRSELSYRPPLAV